MADHTDSGETELSKDPDSSSGQDTEVSAQEYTEYQTTASTTSSTGFDQARNLARKAQSESGRLLKRRFVLEEVLGRGGMGAVAMETPAGIRALYQGLDAGVDQVMVLAGDMARLREYTGT